ncbi:hypothetical protein H6G00_31140 [Leptolyngbya sp. FACHB-541]|uniref:hypothetical protein n=1 Tax=Leptolyngbya sp. FACHB-541 TaxID=2692810 RepID=UPI00168346AB|nr:hypothetical protein [Leptolyngbya sp. FACHB-541]MBD2001002.1 hypothetical protein [Leptolyngbya sp. FACHB-541]
MTDRYSQRQTFLGDKKFGAIATHSKEGSDRPEISPDKLGLNRRLRFHEQQQLRLDGCPDGSG